MGELGPSVGELRNRKGKTVESVKECVVHDILQNEFVPVERWSSGVKFSNIHPRYWRINNKYYDLEPMMDRHPGGREVLEMARDRFDDSTYAFEAHHLNWKKMRKILAKYEVKGLVPPPSKINYPSFAEPGSFYCILRQRVHEYLETVGGPGPTKECLNLFWIILTAWICIFGLLVYTGSPVFCFLNGIVGSWLGGFGHNWVHQKKYRRHAYVLDLLGLNSEAWAREHVLQHHMYTNTPLDNHYKGSDPFLIVDPTYERNFICKWITPFLNPIFLFFGIPVNYIVNTIQLLKGNENFTIGKLFPLLEMFIIAARWGFLRAFLLVIGMQGCNSVYYFTIALMNHNTEAAWDLDKRHSSSDWAKNQIYTSADIDCQLGFYQSMRYLWLNYHTVHHLFPHTDQSKHPGIQKILMATCKEFGIDYEYRSFWPIWKEMVMSFHSPRHLGAEVMLYPGVMG
mmetsp:Transcript_34284/g.45323  ORF Transcript_34284/g.45323 Transcript_34284/m.45323 type:complete len:455 (+) Transcript_34284:57-1421(+)